MNYLYVFAACYAASFSTVARSQHCDSDATAASLSLLQSSFGVQHAMVGRAAGMICPSTAAEGPAAGMKITTVASTNCDKVEAEIKARVNGQSTKAWHDPHNNGTYALQNYGGTLSASRLTGDEKYTDKQIFTLTPDGDKCKIEACSRSQVDSTTDMSTNYCNLKMLYCGTADGCKPLGNDFTVSAETTEKFSQASVDLSMCLVAVEEFVQVQHMQMPPVVIMIAEAAGDSTNDSRVKPLPDNTPTAPSAMQKRSPMATATGNSFSWNWEHRLELLQRASSHTGNAAVVTLVMLILLGMCLIFMLAGLSRPNQEWTVTSAQDLLNKPGASEASKQDTRLPGQFRADAYLPPPALPPPSSESTRPATAPGLMSSLGLDIFSSSGVQAPMASSVYQTPMYLMPEMVVQEPQGAHFFIDGALTPEEQSGFMEVWRVSSDSNHGLVMKLTICEGTRSAPSNQKGVTVELPCNMPVAFMNTQFASSPAGPHGHFSRERHITIYDTAASGALDLSRPFAKVERQAHGITVQRMSGEVICHIASGGYNTDFGNIVDGDGRLIGTQSNRGHSLTGLGMVRGAWIENRRVVQLAQGVDVVLMVCAIISATKLA